MKKKNLKKINTAVIGMGIRNVHAETYKKNNDCNLVYLCDLNNKQKKLYEKKFNCTFSSNAKSVISIACGNFR